MNPTESNNVFQGRTEAIYKVIVIGDPTIGKNALLSRFAHRNLENQTFSSIGVKLFEKQVYLEQENLSANLMLWVIGAVPHFYMQHRDYFKGTDVIVLAFDIARSSTFYNINNWYNITLHYGLKGIPKILVGIRKGIYSEEQRKINSPIAQYLSKKLVAPYFEVCLTTGENVNLIFQTIAELVYKYKKGENWKDFLGFYVFKPISPPDDGDDRFPYPYVYKPPKPPDDIKPAFQAQKIVIKQKEEGLDCPRCGDKLPKGQKFCPICGRDVF